MTTDERIEQLLNRAHQTLDDLPFFYTHEQRKTAIAATRERMHSGLFVTATDYQDMILHLTDVIDRLEWALENQLTRPHREKEDEHGEE